MSKITIIDPNDSDKEQVKAYMVKGERGDDGVSPTVETSKEGNTAFITITDVEGEHDFVLTDGYSPTVTASKVDKTTTITMTDIDGTRTATINDGVDLTGGVPTNGVIAFNGTSSEIPDGYEVTTEPFPTIYTTSEQIIGAWTDNNQIYRKVITFTTVLGLNEIASVNIDTLVNIYGSCESNSQIIPINFYYDADNYVKTYVDNNKLYCDAKGYVGYSAIVIIEYTKTTN